MKKRKWSYVAAAFVSSLVLVGCSSTSSSSSKVDKDSKTIKVALEANTQPLSYTDDNGNLVGYEVDVIAAINKKIDGYQLTTEAVTAEAAEVGLESGTYDVIGGGLFKTDEREKKYLFPDENTGVSTIEIYKRKEDTSIQSLSDLVGRKISPVTANGGIYNLLTKYNEENPDNQVTITLGESGELAQRYQALADGTYDAVVMPNTFGADTIIQNLNLAIEKADKPVRVNATYFLLSKDETEFKGAFDKAVKSLKEDGTLANLSEKWFGQNMFDYEVTADD